MPELSADARQDDSQRALGSPDTHKKRAPTKVVVQFKAVGNAPILQQKLNFAQITGHKTFQMVIAYLRKLLGFSSSEPLFTYINMSFSPAPDEIVSNLYKCFGTNSCLIVNYSTNAAWG